MRSLYRLLLLLYPRSFHDAFAAEMMAVFDQRAAERREKGLLPLMQFMWVETSGLLTGSIRERAIPASLAPVMGGLVAAAALHSVLYAGTLTILNAITAAIGKAPLSHPNDAAAVLIGLCGVTAFLALLPVFFVMSMWLVQRGRS